MLRLKCINTGIIEKKNRSTGELEKFTGKDLKKSAIYTTTGPHIGNNGHLYYPLEELGTGWFVERFEELDVDPTDNTLEEEIAKIQDRLQDLLNKLL